MAADSEAHRMRWPDRAGTIVAALVSALALALALVRTPETTYPVRVFILTGGALALVVRREVGGHLWWRLFLAVSGLALITLCYGGFWGPSMEGEAPGGRLLCEIAAAALACLVVLPAVWKHGPALPIGGFLVFLLAVNGYLFRVWSAGALPQIAALAILPALFLVGPNGLWSGTIGRPLLLLWLVGGVAIIAAPDRGAAVDGWLGLSVAVAVFAVLCRLRHDGLSRTTAAWVLLVSSIPVVAISLLRGIILVVRVGWWHALGARLGALGLNPNVLSGYLVILLPLWMGTVPSLRVRLHRALAMLMIACGLVLQLLTLSKGGWIGFAAGVGVLLALMLRRRSRYALVVGVAALAIVGSVIVARGTGRDSLAKRVLTWRAASQAVLQRPVFGAGLLNSEVHRAFLREEDAERVVTSQEWDLLLGHSHNLLLQVGEGLGFAGLALFGWLVVAAVRSARRSWVEAPRAERWVLVGALGGLAGNLVSGMFLVGYSTPTLIAVETMAALSLIADGKRARPRGGAAAIPVGLVLLLLTLAESHRLAGNEAARHGNAGRFLAEQIAWAKLNPLAATPRAEAGRVLLRHGRVHEAVGWLEAAVARNRSYAPYRVSLGRAYREEGRWLEAMQQFAHALRLDPAYTQPEGGLAAKLELRGLQEDRGDDRKDPTIGALGNRGIREARLGTAEELLESGRIGPAVQLLEAMLEEEPSPAFQFRAAMLLGKARELQGRPGAAARAYLLASSIQEGPDPHEALGRLHLEAGRIKKAVDELELAVAAGAGVDAHVRLAQALESKGDLPRALWAARTAVRMSPDNSSARSMLGRLLFLDGATERAIQELRQAAGLDTTSAKPLVLLAEVYRRQKDYDDALETLSEALAREPGLAWAHKQKAYALQETGRNAEAAEAWGRVLELDADDTEAHYFLGLALSGLNRRDEMALHLRSYVEREPDGRWADQARELLGEGH
jgi:tetratricopeptide (TPR) repeat protein/O-antigen ligase